MFVIKEVDLKYFLFLQYSAKGRLDENLLELENQVKVFAWQSLFSLPNRCVLLSVCNIKQIRDEL